MPYLVTSILLKGMYLRFHLAGTVTNDGYRSDEIQVSILRQASRELDYRRY